MVNSFITIHLLIHFCKQFIIGVTETNQIRDEGSKNESSAQMRMWTVANRQLHWLARPFRGRISKEES